MKPIRQWLLVWLRRRYVAGVFALYPYRRPIRQCRHADVKLYSPRVLKVRRNMELGMIGLGRMGANMTARLLEGGHRVVAYDRSPAAIGSAVAAGAVGAESVESLVKQLVPPRSIWIMVPAGEAVDNTLQALMPMLSSRDVVIDGGNSNYKDTMRRASTLRQHGIEFIDVGTSGGIFGHREGYCLMIGGPQATVERLRSLFETLAPSVNKGWARVGPPGAGHFVKMVHNGIEYG